MNYILKLIYIILIIYFALVLYRTTNIGKTIKENWKSIVLFFIVEFLILNIYTFIRMRMEDFIPYRDFAGFYRGVLELIEVFKHDSFIEIFSRIYNSMLYSEYSYFSKLFLVLPMEILGTSYSRFIISMINLFVIPSNLLFYIFILNSKIKFSS